MQKLSDNLSFLFDCILRNVNCPIKLQAMSKKLTSMPILSDVSSYETTNRNVSRSHCFQIELTQISNRVLAHELLMWGQI